eukprot:5967677-Pyramimonas_sp.AAC.2
MRQITLKARKDKKIRLPMCLSRDLVSGWGVDVAGTSFLRRWSGSGASSCPTSPTPSSRERLGA